MFKILKSNELLQYMIKTKILKVRFFFSGSHKIIY